MSQITCYDSDGNALKRLFQWDSGRVITVRGVNTSNTITCHFSNRLSKDALIVTPTTIVGGFTVHVPNILLQQAEPLNLYIFETDANEHMTTHVITIPVTPRTMPSGYEYDEGIDYLDIVGLTNSVNTLRASVENDQAAIYTATTNANEAADNANAAAEIGSVATLAMGPYNGYDVLAQGTRENGTHNGITFTWNDNECDINGTLAAGQSSAYQTIYYSTNSLPYMVKPGGTLRIKQSIDPAWLGVRFHNGTAWGAWVYRSNTTNAGIVVPDDAVGINVIFGVSASQDHLKVKLALMTETPANDELQARIDTMFQSRGIAQAGTNLNNKTDEGHYLLNSGYGYINAPYDQRRGAFLEVFRTTQGSIMQRITVPYVNEVYIRSSSNGSFSERVWKLVNNGRVLSGKYVAFGDSLMAGAVWSDYEHRGNALHIADESLKIPTRIANAVGATNNYANAAVGGIGYVHKVNSQNLVGQITSSDLTGVELVTVHGGANDKLTAEGTLDAICTAIETIIAYIKTNYPKTQLIIIQPLPSGFSASYDPWTARGAGGWSVSDFDERVGKLCCDNHVGYVNWFGCTYCDTWATRNIGYNSNSGPNYTHPIVDEDYALLGDFIAGKIAAYGVDMRAQNTQTPISTADRLTATTYMVDHAAYSFRSSKVTGQFSDLKREQIIGGTLCWNQLARNGARSGDVVPSGNYEYSSAVATGVTWVKNHVTLLSVELRYTGSNTSTPMGAWMRVGDATDPDTQLKVLWSRTGETPMNTGVNRRCFGIAKYTGTLPANQVYTSFGPSVGTGGTMTATDTWHYDNVMGFDLTAMFGQGIAEWLLAQGADAAGAWFVKHFPKSYYAHADRNLMSVRARRNETVGANLLDPKTGKAKIKGNTTYVIPWASNTPTVSFVDLNGDTADIELFHTSSPLGIGTLWAIKSDRDGVVTISGISDRAWLCASDRAFSNIIKQEYSLDKVDYEKHSYLFDDRPLYGVPMFNSLYTLGYDGDVYNSDGAITRNYACVDLGTLTWSGSVAEHVFICTMGRDSGEVAFADSDHVMIGSTYSIHPTSLDSISSLEDGQWYIPSHRNWIALRNDNASTPTEMKASLSGVLCVYKKPEATVEAAGPFTEMQVLDPYGTEEFIDAGVEMGERDVAIPVGHNTKYIDNLLYKLEKLPWPSDYYTGNCFIRNTDRGQMILTDGGPSIPAAPKTDGSYHLVATVVNGAPKYNWVSD